LKDWTPVDGIDDARFVAVDHGGNIACIVRGSGALDCWGETVLGEFGAGTPRSSKRTTPAPIAGLPPVVGVSLDAGSICVWTQQGDVYCWGRNTDHEVSPESKDVIDVPTKIDAPPLHGVVALVSHKCGLDTSGIVWCWGPVIPDGHGGFTSTARPVKRTERGDELTVDWKAGAICVVDRRRPTTTCLTDLDIAGDHQ
jgi:alpha-tubulin suppressor-like RCC1 family protein